MSANSGIDYLALVTTDDPVTVEADQQEDVA